MNIKRNDNVRVIAGKDRGKEGKVTQVFPEKGKVVVEGANRAFKHVRANRQGGAGQKLEFFSPLSASNVLLVCPKCAKPTRTGLLTHRGPDGKPKKVRTCKKCGEAIE
ncbi:50S ribosomal protein L24 [Candidatus Uhrbacteria bacterium]|nr:50S ribosomal protein L24 [Candidatus Uhrbacteria bacterium]